MKLQAIPELVAPTAPQHLLYFSVLSQVERRKSMSICRLNVLSDVLQELHGVPLFLFSSSHDPPLISKSQSRYIQKFSAVIIEKAAG